MQALAQRIRVFFYGLIVLLEKVSEDRLPCVIADDFKDGEANQLMN